MYGKNADRSRTEAQPIAVHPRATHAPGSTITLDTGLVIPQVNITWAHAGSRPHWAAPYGGYSEGINEWGVGIGNEMFPSRALPTDHGRAPQAEFTDLDRLVLERSKSAAEAVQVLTALISKYGQTCRTCPEAANYNSLFMIADTTEIYSVMAVGHEWAYSQFTEANTNGTGVWTISNYPFFNATHVSPTAQATAEKLGWYRPGSGAPFDFGRVYGDTRASDTRHLRSMTLLRDLASDHQLTKEDLMTVLKDHSYGHDLHEPPVSQIHWIGTEIDEHTFVGGITASSMVSEFKSNGVKIAWHSLTNPCMAVFYPTIFHHDGHVSAVPAWLGSVAPWWGFRFVAYNLAKTDTAKIEAVRAAWLPVQQRFFAEADAKALAANGMDAAAADAMLAAFMVNVSTTIRTTLEHLNKTLA